MNIGKYAKRLSIIYDDRLDIYRHKVVDNEDGTSENILLETPIYSNIPCRVSEKTADYPDGKSGLHGSPIDVNGINIIGAMLCPLDIDVKKGDYLKITRYDGGKQYGYFEGIAAQPKRNPLCQRTLILHETKESEAHETEESEAYGL